MHIYKQHFQSCFCSNCATLATDMIQDCAGKKIHQKENQRDFHLELHKYAHLSLPDDSFHIYTEQNMYFRPFYPSDKTGCPGLGCVLILSDIFKGLSGKVDELCLRGFFRRKRGQWGERGGWGVKLLCITA